MAIHGGIIGGIIGTLIYAKIKKVNPLTLGDFAAGPFILGQAIGRIGNFMNGEVHGVPTFTPLSVIFSGKFNEWWAKYHPIPRKDCSVKTRFSRDGYTGNKGWSICHDA